jgi:flagellar hook protein FlgE
LQVTSFATGDLVYSMSVDGRRAGTGSHVSVETAGEVSVAFDNGDALYLGTLALARFAREAALATDKEGLLYPTPRSGPPQLGNPLSPGRGSVQSAADPDSTLALDGSALGL